MEQTPKPVEDKESAAQPVITGSNPALAKKSKLIPIISGVVLVAVLLLGFGYYYVKAAPGKVWEKFTATTPQPTTASQTYAFAYKDNEKVSDAAAANPISAYFSNVGFSAKGNAYMNDLDATNPEGSASMQYSLSSGSTSFGSSMQLILKGQDIFINPGDNPLFASALSLLSPEKKVTWIKINAREIAEASQTATSSSPSINMSQQMAQYQTILSKHWGQLVMRDKNLGNETLRGVSTYHYSNTINKTELKQVMHEVMDYAIIQAQTTNPSSAEEIQSSKDLVYSVLDSIVDRMQITSLETWLGQQDARIYKVKLVSSVPSLASLVSNATAMESEGTATSTTEEIKKLMAAVSYNATLNVDEEFFDYGKIQEVKVPDNALDIGQKIKEENAQQQKYMNSPADGTKLMQ